MPVSASRDVTESRDVTDPTPRVVTRARAAVAAAFVVHGLLFASWTAHIPSVQHHLQLSDGGLGLTLLGAPIGAVASLSLVGPLLPYLGSRRAVRLSLVVHCLAGILVGVAGSPSELFAALLVWGFGQGALDVSMNTQAVYVERLAARPIMSGLHGGWGLGAFAGAALGAVAVALGIGLVPQLAVLGPIALVVTLALSRWLVPDAAHQPDPSPRGRFRLPPVLLLLAVAAFGSMLCEGAAADWSAVYLRGSVGTSAGLAGLGYTTFALALVAVRLAGNRLLRSASTARLVAAGAAVAALGFAVGLTTRDVPGTLVGLALLGAGLGLVVPSCFAAAGRQPSVHPGRAVALVSGLGSVGFVVGPPAIGGLASLSTLHTALYVVPALALLAAAASHRALRT
jgi:MFS family permease